MQHFHAKVNTWTDRSRVHWAHGYIGHTGTFFLSFSDCLSRESQTKISAVLNNMVTVGSVDCAEEEALCKFLGRRSGVVFYPAKEVTPERETVCELVLKLCSIFFSQSDWNMFLTTCLRTQLERECIIQFFSERGFLQHMY